MYINTSFSSNQTTWVEQHEVRLGRKRCIYRRIKVNLNWKWVQSVHTLYYLSFCPCPCNHITCQRGRRRKVSLTSLERCWAIKTDWNNATIITSLTHKIPVWLVSNFVPFPPPPPPHKLCINIYLYSFVDYHLKLKTKLGTEILLKSYYSAQIIV